MTPAEDYNAVHSKRYEQSLLWIADLADKAERILDVGGESPFTEIIRKRWPGKLVPYYGGDLKNGFDLKEPVDLILAMEVAEHIHDRETDEISTEWTNSGVLKMLASCHLSLKEKGILFLTSPNCASITSLHHCLSHRAAMLYRPHVREFSVYELDMLVQQSGFTILKRETVDSWRNAISDEQHKRIAQFIKASHYPTELRGENIFVIAEKSSHENN